MLCRVLACDFDGTGATNGRLAPEVASALAAARARGYATLLVTGRVVEDLRIAEVDFTSFDAVVAENGAVLWWPTLGRELKLGTPPSEAFLADLRARGVSFVAGAIVVGTWDHCLREVVDTIRKHGMASQIAFNRAALMVLPSGIDKAVGVRHALAELGRSERNMIAFGDAENDRPLFELAEIGVAARGAVPGLAAIADDQLSLPGGAGVAHYIERLLANDGLVATPARDRIEIGNADGGERVLLPGSGENVLVTGDPRCGKSELAGLVAEQLVANGYRLCILDPEGDHLGLTRSRILALGTDLPLPRPGSLPRILASTGLSVVVNLASLPHRSKVEYVSAALAALAEERVRTGTPHWTFVDEAHYFFAPGSTNLAYVESPHGNVLLATYRPSLIADEVHARVAANLVMHTEVDEERYCVTGLLQRHGVANVVPAEAMAALERSRVALLRAGRWLPFTPRARVTPHAHHGKKYADTLLPWDKAFRFLNVNGDSGPVARSITEFATVLGSVPLTSLRHHLLHGDFSRWALETLGDATLAAGLGKLEHTTRAGAPPAREEVLRHVREWYLV
jgi:hydroxymethylpyrimidine pyrophosphatase-like HAD family hydrolase